MKLAVIEAEYHTLPAPAPFTLIGLPNDDTQHVDYAVKIPWMLGLIATRSLDEEVKGLDQIRDTHREKIIEGAKAYVLLM